MERHPGRQGAVVADCSPSRAATETSLRDLLDPVVRGSSPRGQSVAVIGPAGIGKTHLTATYAEWARSTADCHVLTARGDPLHNRSGYALVGDLVGAAPGHDDPAEFAFARVDRLCSSGPVLVCVDDLHQVDGASLRVLRRLVWAARDLPLAVLLVGRAHPVRDQVDALLIQTASRIHLAPMAAPDVFELTHAVLGRRPSPRLTHALRAAGGNPLFVKELLRTLRSARLLHRVSDDEVDLVGDHGVAIGAELGPLLRESLSDLDDSALELLGVLAVRAAPAPLGEIAEIMYTTGDALRPTLDHLRDSGLVTYSPTEQIVAVSHDVYRDGAYNLMYAPTRRALHRRVAAVLDDKGSSAAVVAEHLMRATDGADSPPDQTVARVLWQAIGESRDFAPSIAAELLAEVPIYAGDKSASAASEQARALLSAGQVREAVEFARAELANGTDPEALFEVLLRSQIDSGQTTDALRTLSELLASPHLEPELRRELEQTHAWVRILAGDWRDAAAEITATLPALIENDHRDAQSRALTSLSCAAHLDGRSLEAVALIEESFALDLGDQGRRERTTALIWPPLFELYAHGVASARQSVQDVRVRAQESGSGWLSLYHCFVAAGTAFTAGDWNHAVAEYTAGLELAEETGSGWISIAVGQLAYIEAHRGRFREAQDRLREFSSRRLPLQFGMDDPGWANLAILEVAGNPAATLAYARAFWTAARASGAAWMLQVAPDVARIGLVCRDHRLTVQIADAVSGLDTSGCRAVSPNVDLVVGMSTGDVDLIETAARRAAGFEYTMTAAAALEEAACAAAVDRQLARARGHADEALAIYQQAGASTDCDRLLSRIRELGVRRGPRQKHSPARSGPASLTAAEMRVARLVRDGLTNPEIGVRLYLSPRTVQVHVSHILGKLGVRSRVEVATVFTAAPHEYAPHPGNAVFPRR
ncbi:LuxR C-terminal-related transcriptional regulator [Gordonia sp. HY442]|uniref:helix-turn-helix transcriptional regulator n=1 Tax=Gordonia zhenghanii TaxID=2911516 RepID=UPI001F02B7B6|nr:LuxR family transcriptional regulator [Gordonia zhenghanii]MCF8607446.1 LuxR C-terminal-related transcriptional regulator [Gordonia zhenghanii]